MIYKCLCLCSLVRQTFVHQQENPPHAVLDEDRGEENTHHSNNSALKNLSQGPGLPFPTRPFTFFVGLFSPIAPATVLTTLFNAKSSTGLFFTCSRQVGHVYVGWGPPVCCAMRA